MSDPAPRSSGRSDSAQPVAARRDAGHRVVRVGPDRYCPPCCRTLHHPSFLELNAFHDVASNICMAHCQRRHRPASLALVFFVKCLPKRGEKCLSGLRFGCIFELEGVLVKSRAAEHKMSWLRLAEERGEPTPPEMVGRCSLNLVRPRVDRALLPR